MTAGMAMWCFNQACWVWFEVVVRKPLPDPFRGDIVLFLHVVPIMAAVAIRPHEADEREGMLPSALNVIILLVWWVVVYAFFVFPEEYVVTQCRGIQPALGSLVFHRRNDLDCRVSIRILHQFRIVARTLSQHFFRQRSVHILFGSHECRHRARHLQDWRNLRPPVPRRCAWVSLGRYRRAALPSRYPDDACRSRVPVVRVAPELAKLALLSLPMMGYWALFLSNEQPYLRQVRFAVAMGGVAVLAFSFSSNNICWIRGFCSCSIIRARASTISSGCREELSNKPNWLRSENWSRLPPANWNIPLSAILSSSERMAASSNLSREQLSNAQKIGQQARRTRELVSDLLSFSQQTPGEKSSLELKPLLQRAVQMEGFKLENKKISLTVESNDPLPRVLGNPNQLLQAFLQIVENAVDALQEIGGGRLQVSLWREANEVVVQFADSGPGLRDPERVFDPFYTTKPVGKGTGLGLSATYGVIQDHKGQITCYNRPEGGAAFEIRLPVLKVTAPLAEAARV